MPLTVEPHRLNFDSKSVRIMASQSQVRGLDMLSRRNGQGSDNSLPSLLVLAYMRCSLTDSLVLPKIVLATYSVASQPIDFRISQYFQEMIYHVIYLAVAGERREYIFWGKT